MSTKLITRIIHNYPKKVISNIVFLTLFVSLNLCPGLSTGELYAQNVSDVSTNDAFFQYLSVTIAQRPALDNLEEVTIETELPTPFAQRLRSSLLQNNIKLSSNADLKLILNFSTTNIYKKTKRGDVKRNLTGTTEVLIQNGEGEVTKQELIEYSFEDRVSSDAFNRLTRSELTKPDQINEAPKGLWQKFGVPAIILSGIGTATVLLFYVRG